MNLHDFFLFLADQTLKGALILALAWLVSHLFRSASAAKRNTIWLSAFVALLLLPLTHLTSPQWTWNLASDKRGADLKTVAVTAHPAEIPQEELSRAGASAPANRTWQWPDWKTALIALWCLGAGLVLLRRIIAAVQLQWLFRKSEPARPGILHKVLAELLITHGIAPPIRLRTSPLCHVPMTWGVVRPIILLPRDAHQWSEERLRIVLAHELAHICRWDSATRTLACLGCAFHWFNPLAWLEARKLCLTQEQACDDLVLSSGADAATYAAELVESVRRFQFFPRTFRHALAMAQPSTLEKRVCAIVDTQRPRGTAGLLPIVTGVTTVALSLFASAVGQVSDSNAQPPQPAAHASAAGDKVIEYASYLFDFPTGEPPERLRQLTVASRVRGDEPSFIGLLTEPEVREFISQIQQQKGIDLLTAPRLTAAAGQKGTVQIGNEVEITAADGGTKKVWEGSELEITGTLGTDAAGGPPINLTAGASYRFRQKGEEPVTEQSFATVTLRPTQVILREGAGAVFRLAPRTNETRELWLLVTAKPQSTAATSTPRPAGAAPAPSGKAEGIAFPEPISLFDPAEPIKLDAESTSTTGGVVVARGNSTFEQKDIAIASDSIIYDANAKMVHATGNVKLTQGQNTVEAEDLELDLQTGRVKTRGPSKTKIADKSKADGDRPR